MVREGEPASNRAIKLRLFPTEKQAKFFRSNFAIRRKAYNWALAKNLAEYEEWGKVKDAYKEELIKEGYTEEDLKKLMKDFAKANKNKYVSSPRQLSALFNQETKEKPEEYGWFKQYDSYAKFYSISLDYDSAIKSFERGYNKRANEISKKIKENIAKGKKRSYSYPKDYGFPQFKNCRENSYPTVIAVNKIDTDNRKVYIPKIGWVKFSKNQKIPSFQYPSVNAGNPRVTTDGKNYFLSFGYYAPVQHLNTPKTEVIGIDLGLKNTAILSNGEVCSNVAKDERVVKLLKKKKKLQHKLNWLMDHAEPCYAEKVKYSDDVWRKKRWSMKTRHIVKIKNLLTKLEIRLNNIKNNKLHADCRNIILKNPEGIILEELNIKGMMKNKKIAKGAQNSGLYKFKSTLINHAVKYDITVKDLAQSSRYASTQVCSKCGEKNPEMKGYNNLNKRTFVCPHCGNVMDRDVNAANNLKNWFYEDSAKVCT